MFTSKLIAAAAAVISVAGIASSSSAQDYGHGHGGYAQLTHVCYEKFSTPDVYGTVKKAVVKEAGRWEVQTTEAVYAIKERKVLVEAGKEIVHVTPPTYKIEKTSHKVADHYGHERYVTHASKVRVDDGKQTVEKTEPVYKTEQVKVLVKPATATKIWHPPVYGYVEEKVLLKHGRTFVKPVHKGYGEAC